MAHHISTVRDGCLQDLTTNGNPADTLAVGSAEWCAWLEHHCSFRFETDCTALTARKEQRPGGWYWYAYRRKQGKLHSAYLGKSEELTLDRLSGAFAKYGVFSPGRRTSGNSETADGGVASPKRRGAYAHSNRP